MSDHQNPEGSRLDDVALETVTTCILCGSTDLRSWRPNRPDSRGTSQRLTYVRCAQCGCGVLSPRVPEAAIGGFYGHSYAPYSGGASATSPASVGRAGTGGPLQAQLARTYPESRGEHRVLDFGCGSAAFLNSARDLGWRTIGVDFTDEGLNLARAAGHEVRLVDDEFWDWVGEQQFDVIRLSHVIEHLYQPRQQVGELLRALKPGGVLHIITPDPLGPACQLIRNHCCFFEVVHVSLIPPIAVTKLADQLGASQTHIEPEPVIKDLWRSWLLATGRIKSYEGAPQDPPSRWVRAGFMALAFAAARAGRSDRYHAFVTR